jgi:sulfur-oxidizing protein SoxY
MTARPASRTLAAARPNLGRRAVASTAAWLTLAALGLAPVSRAAVLPPTGAVEGALAALAAGTVEGLATESDRVQLTLPKLIEDGAVVPVTVQTTLAEVRDIYLLADMNPAPIAAEFRIGSGMAPRMSVRIKLAGSGRVYGVVRTAKRLHWAAVPAEVTLGGCS